MEATGICPPPAFLQCPGKPSCTWTDRERQFETFLVAVGVNDFTAIRKKALLLHSVGAEAQRVFHSQPPAIKATDQVVEKTVHLRLRERFLQNNKLTLDVVVTQAEAYEGSKRESQEMEEPACNTFNFTREEATWEVQKTTALQGKGTVKGDNCGKREHLARNSQCPARQSQCWRCGKLGHWAASCRSSGFKKVQKCEEEGAILSYSDKKHLGRLTCQVSTMSQLIAGQHGTALGQPFWPAEDEYWPTVSQALGR
ncbi:hypothetical protein O3P69_003871 [Scylla paramamosain]|uniref:CCHC-type domain-containing protein n=1 Tax=Scylla paramamosain TaxID=85552 RepID=A0AAW0UG31_SCYPA